jgi:hypothetical protein
MAYIGAVAPGYDPTRASVPQLDAERFNGDASTTAFTLTRQVVSPTDINVIVENVLQEPTVAYSVSGYTLNFTEAPPTGTNNIYVIYRGSATSNYAYVPDGSITYAKLANNIRQFTVDTFTANGTGSTVALTEAPASANSLIVSVDGVIQTAPTNYTLSGSTITFTGVPDNGANVVVKHIGFRTTSTVTALQASSVTSTELADGSVTNAKIVSVANTKITGNIVSSQITSVANTQITGNIISSQITSIGGSQITANTIANSAIQTGAVENYMNATGLSFGMRNRIINGAMVIDQRNAGASITTNAYVTDRWLAEQTTDGVRTAQQVSDAPTGFVKSLKLTTTTADASLAATQYSLVRQGIEGFNTADLMWGTANAQTITISFWVKSSLTGTFGGVAGNSAFDRSYPFTYSISSANTWEQKTVTIAGDTTGTWETTNSAGIQLYFGLGAGSTYSGTAGAWTGSGLISVTGAVSVIGTLNATWQITGVQLEKGSTATSFDYRPYGTELQLCQRYYWKIAQGTGEPYGQTGYNIAGNAVWQTFGFPVTMRATPTVTIYGTWAVSNTGQPTVRGASSTNFLLQIVPTATGIATAYPNSSDDLIDASIEL